MLGGGGQIENPYPQGTREWYAHELTGTGVPADVEERRANSADFITDIMPGVGEVKALQDAWQSSGRGGEKLMSGDFTGAGGEYATMLADLAGGVLPFAAHKMTSALMPSDPKNTVGMFAGPNAKTADHEALAKAKAMREEGKTPQEIWDETGWFRNHGKWRYEIPDNKAKVDLNPEGVSGPVNSVGQVVDHPELFAAYPEVADTYFRRTGQPGTGSFGGTYGKQFPPSISAGPKNATADKRVMLHEMQHGVDQIEGAPRGGSRFDGDDYERMAGEVSARNVETRRDMTDEELAANPPWTTQDMPESAQVVEFGDPDLMEIFTPVDSKTGKRLENMFDDMLDEGADWNTANKQIYEQEGKFFSTEGALRGEISDQGMTVKTSGVPGESYELSEVIDHPELFDAYPELKNRPVRFIGENTEFGSRTARTADDGAIMLVAGQSERAQRAQLAKTLQYAVDEKSGFANAGRETSAKNIADAENAVARAEKLISTGGVDKEAGDAFVEELRGALKESADTRANHPGKSVQRRAAQQKFWQTKSAGKQHAKSVKHRAYEGNTDYPYDRVPESPEDLINIPFKGLPDEAVKDFIERWHKFGASGKRKKGK